MGWGYAVFTIFVTLVGVFIGFVFSLVASYYIERFRGRNVLNALIEDMMFNMDLLRRMLRELNAESADNHQRARVCYLNGQVVQRWRTSILENNIASLAIVMEPSELNNLSKLAIKFDELNSIHSEFKGSEVIRSTNQMGKEPYVDTWKKTADEILKTAIPEKRAIRQPWFLKAIPRVLLE